MAHQVNELNSLEAVECVPMIQAGKISQINLKNGRWIFLDIGFSGKQKTCGLIFADGEPECLKFGEAKRRIIADITASKSPINLAIEAPLSVCFSPEGEPKGRDIEKDGRDTRYWYSGPGCAVMTAAIYLVRAIYDTKPSAQVRLFEAFISYKQKGKQSDHKRDAWLIREAVSKNNKKCFKIAKPLDARDKVKNAFTVAGIDCKLPAIIKIDRKSAERR
jgi:hypothetical protein